LTDPDRTASGLFRLVVAGLLVGALTGAVGASFRLALSRAEHLRDLLVGWAHGAGWWGVLVPALCAGAATLLARWLVVRFAHHAGGSGIPQVEAFVRMGDAPAPLAVLPVKFLGGLSSIGAGMVVGREGPTVQMGASIAEGVARLFRLQAGENRVLVAGGAGAGLSTAFGAPIGGAVFILEEVLQRFHGRTTIAVLAATGAAAAVTDAMLGGAPIFHVDRLVEPSPLTLFLYLGFGLVLGVLGAVYNRLVLASLDLGARLPRLPPPLFAGAIGVAVGLLAYLDPRIVGGGEREVQSLLLGVEPGLGLLVAYAAVRFVLGPICYSALTPGGLFAPILLLGAALGAIAARVVHPLFPLVVPDATGFVIAGAVAFFTATVRAPVTGVVLLVEMTDASPLLMPMLVAACGAFVGASLLGSVPIYDALRERL
jgi:CIC family chloride channel protein